MDNMMIFRGILLGIVLVMFGRLYFRRTDWLAWLVIGIGLLMILIAVLP